jgi:hypothetical protein
LRDAVYPPSKDSDDEEEEEETILPARKDASSASQALYNAMMAIRQAFPELVREVADAPSPVCAFFGADENRPSTAQLVDTGMINSWSEYWLNLMRGAPNRGAAPWDEEQDSVLNFGRKANVVTKAKRLFSREHPLTSVQGRPCPPPALTNLEASWLGVPSDQSGAAPEWSIAKLVTCEQNLSIASEGLAALDVLVLALNRALRDPQDRHALCDLPDTNLILDILDGITGGVSYAAGALSAPLVDCRVTRRLAALRRSGLSELRRAQLSLAPLSSEGLFGDQCKKAVSELARQETPLTVESLTSALRAAVPQASKSSQPALSGQGNKKKQQKKWYSKKSSSSTQELPSNQGPSSSAEQSSSSRQRQWRGGKRVPRGKGRGKSGN